MGAIRYALQTDWPLPEAPAEPIDLALGSDDRLYVADGRQNAVLVYGTDDAPLDMWFDPPTGPLPGYVYVPRAVATDAARGLVYVLWQRFREQPPDLVATGLFLDSRRPDGASARPLQAITFMDTADDMAVSPRTGDIFFKGDGFVSRLRMPARVPIPGFPVGDADGRIAITGSGLVAVANGITRRLDLYTIDGARAGRLSTNGHRPRAVADDGSGRLHVLVQPDVVTDPDSAILVAVDPVTGATEETAARALGVPVLPEGDWPHALSLYGDVGALTTASERFEVHRFERQGPSVSRLVGARKRDAYAPRGVDVDAIGAGVSLDVAPTGELLVLDVKAAQIVSVSSDGAATLRYGVPDGAVDFAVGPLGNVYVTTDHGRMQRLTGSDPDAPPVWDVPCDCGLGGRVAATHGHVYVSRTREQSAAAFDVADGTERHWHALDDAVGLWPSDVATEGSALYTGDMVTARVHAWAVRPDPEHVWQTGLLSGPRRLAVGEAYDGTPVLAAVMGDGYVEIYSIADGNLLSRWQPRARDGARLAPSDIAIGAQGEIVVSDARARRIYVYAPGSGVPATPDPQPAATATPSALSCDVRGGKVAAPSTVVLGDTAGVTLTLAATCPSSTRLIGADIVLVIDRSGSMEGAKMVAAKRAARSFAELLDVRHHRLGLASFSGDASVDVPLTDSIPAVIDGLDGLRPEGGTNMAAALERARANLEAFGRLEALPVIVLLSDGRNNDDLPDPRAVAQDVRNWGAQVYTIGLGGDVDEGMLRDIAGDPGGYFYAPTPSELFPIYGEILRIVLSSLAGNLVIDDEMSSGVTYVPDSSKPAALVSERHLRWGRSILPSSGLTLTYRVKPLAPGCTDVNHRAVADYTDADGERRRFTFPVPTVCAVTPTPTPTREPTPTASATPTPVALYVPVTFKHGCLPGRAHADAVLVIDTSSSMSGDKLASAKAAARSFVELMQLPRDQVAVLGFSEEPFLATPLTRSAEVASRAIDALSVGRGTRIDRALWAAGGQLRDSRHDPRNRAVIVLMTDGGHAGGVADVLDLAGEVRAMPATLYAIGLGADADADLLRAVAGSPDRYFHAPTERELREIYRRIAVSIPCR